MSIRWLDAPSDGTAHTSRPTALTSMVVREDSTMTQPTRPPIPRAQRSCVICRGNGWQSPHAVPARADAQRGDLIAIWMPCSECWDTVPVPDNIKIPIGSGRPIYGTHWTWTVDVCRAGNPAVNERCGDLRCVCAPTIVPALSRVWRIDNRDPKPEHRRRFLRYRG